MEVTSTLGREAVVDRVGAGDGGAEFPTVETGRPGGNSINWMKKNFKFRSADLGAGKIFSFQMD